MTVYFDFSPSICPLLHLLWFFFLSLPSLHLPAVFFTLMCSLASFLFYFFFLPRVHTAITSRVNAGTHWHFFGMNSKTDHFYLFIYSSLSVQPSTGFCLPGWNHPSELFSAVKRDHLRESQQERKEAEVSQGRQNPKRQRETLDGMLMQSQAPGETDWL